ncbi:MAG TPA: SRPBCC family protein [Candidatus Eisenbacteria bacterium]|nr:SRPBCC family protein [Candidatus Eisenbacteria bacterium]
MNAPKHVYEVYIRTTPEKLWNAITRPEMTQQYFYGTAVESDWKVGSSVRHLGANGEVNLDGKVLELVPQQKLAVTFAAVHNPASAKDRPSRVTWEIQALGDVCKLTLTHDDFDGVTETYKQVGSGWNPVLSGLKTLLETGTPLAIPRPAAAKN